jgi:hypothetical protein
MTDPVTEALDYIEDNLIEYNKLDFGFAKLSEDDREALATLRTALDHAAGVRSTVDIAIARVQRDEVRIADLQARLDALVEAAGAVVGCRGAGVGTRSLWMDIQALENALKAAKSKEAS